MLLYHGSNVDIAHIDLGKCRPYKDFGRGFYLTDIQEQAEKMAHRTARIYGGSPVVNIYAADDSFMERHDLRIKNFGTIPSEDWAVFVMNNRNRHFADIADAHCNHDNKYDIVVGPIADDDMVLLFRQFQNGLIALDALVRGMTFRETTSQFSFHTEKSLQLLRKVSAP